MVLLTISSAALDAIKVYFELLGETAGHDGEPSLYNSAIGDPISHGQLIEISRILGQRKDDANDVKCAVDLNSLLRGSRVYVPPPAPKPEKSPEYVRLMARLREEEARKEYERMINPPPPHETAHQRFPGTKTYGSGLSSEPVVQDVDETTFADINRQLTLIINVLVSVIACSAGIWITAWHWPTPARLGLSMGGSGVVAAAEIAIYFGYLKRLSDAKTKERRTVESKEIMDTWVLDGRALKSGAANPRNEGLRNRRGKHR